MMRVPVVLACLLAMLVTLHAQPNAVQTVRVAAASDLQFAFDEVITRLQQREPNLRVQVTYGSSGTLHAQLRQRAPYDVYLSADIEYPRDLVSRGIGSAGDLFTYATGRVVIWVPRKSTLPIERDGLRALTHASRIAIGNPRHAPYGRAAESALRQALIWDQVKARLVLGENVAQTAQFVQSGAADAGIIAKSLAVAPAMRTTGRFWDVPDRMHPPLIQGGLILPWARSQAAARRVREYLESRDGQQLLESYGFGPPPR